MVNAAKIYFRKKEFSYTTSYCIHFFAMYGGFLPFDSFDASFIYVHQEMAEQLSISKANNMVGLYPRPP